MYVNRRERRHSNDATEETIEDLVNRINMLEITVVEIQRENREIQRENRILRERIRNTRL